jgi:multidrug efflux pump subunit AcrA (membrane-fusion protein)
MTAYAADETATSTATYTGQSFDVTVSWENAVTSSDYDSIILIADAAVVKGSSTVAAEDTLATISLESVEKTSISVSGLTASTAGTITFTALGVKEEESTTLLGTTTVTITAAEIESVSDITGSVKYIPNYKATNLTYTPMELTAKESFNYSSAADDLEWVVLDDEGNDVTSSFSFTDADGTSGLATTATSFSESVTISAASLNSDSDAIDAGTYTVKVYPSEDTSTYKTYDFTVVDTTSIGTYSVTDENDDEDNSVTLSIGDTRQLTAYYNNKKVSGITWSVPTGTTAVTVGESSGLVTAVEATSSGIGVTATYALNDDMAIVLSPAYTVAVSADSYSVYIGDDTDVDTLEIGDTTTATLMYGKKAVTSGITWTSSNTSVATIDSSGNITAVAAGSATFTVKYKSDAGTYTTLTTETLTVSDLSYVYTNADGKAITTANVVIGETYQLYVSRSDGKDITGTVTWKSSNKNVATVNSSGLVTVDSEATAANTATITAYINGTSVGSYVTITAIEAVYTAKVVKSDGTSAIIAASEGTASLYYGETLNLTALYNGSEVDGEWVIDSDDTTGNIKVTTAGVVSVIKTVAADDEGTTVLFNAEDSDGVISLKVTVKADAITMYQDDEEVTLSGTSPAALTYSIVSMEQGETAKFTVKLGSTDITSDAVWKATDEDIVSVSGGVITAVAEGYGATAPVTATYTLDEVTYTVTITVTKIIGSTGAIEASETAETEAATATTKATEATEAAETAQTAAAVAKANPTDANLKAATDALAEANSALSAAQSALKTAQAALAEAEAAGAKSDGAQAAVDAAAEAVEAAEANVAAAEKAVETATAAVKEASTAVDEKKAADAAAEKAAAQATGATGTDSASGNAYKVTDGSSKTVAITKVSSKASGKVTIPSTVTISGDKFTVTEISANAFKGNKKIKQVVIPKTVTKIGKNAFKNCSKVTKITIKANKNLTVGKNAFKGLKDGSKIVVKGVSGSAKKKLVKKIKKQVTSSRTTVK